MPSPGDDKALWRRWARSLQMPAPAVVDAINDALARFLRGIDGIVLGYVALPDELDVAAALGTVGPGRLALPRLGDHAAMTIHIDDGRREGHRLGFAQPSADAARVEPDTVAAVVVPGRVFDRLGYRLGRGGGHYDRLLPRLAPGVPTIGVTWRDRVVDALPVEAHDRPMTHLVTQAGVRTVA